MVDLSKPLERIKQAIDRRNYELALTLALECQEVSPTTVELYQLLLDAAKKRAKEGGKSPFSLGLSFGGDAFKKFGSAVKKVAYDPALKNLIDAGRAAARCAEGGANGMLDISILLYEEAHSSGLFNKDLLWELGNVYYKQFSTTKDSKSIDRAIDCMKELYKAMPNHPDAVRCLNNWQADKAIKIRGGKATEKKDFTGQVADTNEARKQEAYGRVVRSKEDADEVISFIDQDIKANPRDKRLWIKRGDVSMKISDFVNAKRAFEKALECDPHDFHISIRLGDVEIQALQAKILAAKSAGKIDEIPSLEAKLLEVELGEYKKRAERQPTEMSHQFSLGQRYFLSGQIDQAASAFQRAGADPRFKRYCHRYLGECFAKKGLLDLAAGELSSAARLIQDEYSAESKDVLYRLGTIYQEMGRKSDAIETYTKLVKIDLAFKDAAQRLGKLQAG
jgi:tetratricopeptide (TPR) repeat protein